MASIGICCFGQTTPLITQKATESPCSNTVTRDKSTVTLTCTGLNPEQTRLIKEIPNLLLRLQKMQIEDTAEILSRLQKCIEQGGPRVLGKQVNSDLTTKLSISPPSRFTVQVDAINETPESDHYANELNDLFTASHWETYPVAQLQEYLGQPPLTGIVVFVRDQHSIPTVIVRKAFAILSNVEYGINPRLSTDIEIRVGQKPID